MSGRSDKILAVLSRIGTGLMHENDREKFIYG
jgi:hypothetical protein